MNPIVRRRMKHDSKSPEFVLCFIRHFGEVDMYPIVEFFGADEVLFQLVAEGFVEEMTGNDQLHTYRLTGTGENRIKSLPPLDT